MRILTTAAELLPRNVSVGAGRQKVSTINHAENSNQAKDYEGNGTGFGITVHGVRVRVVPSGVPSTTVLTSGQSHHQQKEIIMMCKTHIVIEKWEHTEHFPDCAEKQINEVKTRRIYSL